MWYDGMRYGVFDYIIDFYFLKLIYEYIMFNQDENVLWLYRIINLIECATGG